MIKWSEWRIQNFKPSRSFVKLFLVRKVYVMRHRHFKLSSCQFTGTFSYWVPVYFRKYTYIFQRSSWEHSCWHSQISNSEKFKKKRCSYDSRKYSQKPTYTVQPVSYTHLDVYKRQGYSSFKLRSIQCPNNFKIWPPLNPRIQSVRRTRRVRIKSTSRRRN